MSSIHDPHGVVSITLSGSDSVAVKEATQTLQRLLGEGFILSHGPLEEAGVVEVGCEYRPSKQKPHRHLRVVARKNPFRAFSDRS